jgi:hypothetical protein
LPPHRRHGQPAEDAVLEAVANAVVAHLHGSVRASGKGSAEPVLIQVDGPGRTIFLEKLVVLTNPVARRLADGVRGIRLARADIESFTAPRRAPRKVRHIEDSSAVAG